METVEAASTNEQPLPALQRAPRKINLDRFKELMNWWEFGVITAAGAAGGLLAWLIGQGADGLDYNWYFTFPTAIIAGAVAAGTGVYVIASTDRSNMPRALCFALLCGLAWQPVLEAGKGIVGRATVSASVTNAAAEIEKTTGKKDVGAEDIPTLVRNTAIVAKNLQAVSDPKKQQDARDLAIKGIEKLDALAWKDKDATIRGLKTICEQATAGGSFTLQSAAMSKLADLSPPQAAAPAPPHVQ